MCCKGFAANYLILVSVSSIYMKILNFLLFTADYSSSDGDSSNGSDPSTPTDALPQNDLQLYENQQFYQHFNVNPQAMAIWK